MAGKGPPWTIEPLGKYHSRADFTCEEPALVDYLQKQASQDAKRFAAAPFVAVAPGSKDVLGYYTLSATMIELADVPEDQVSKLARYPFVSATLLGRLARDKRLKKDGLGEFLLMDALHRALLQSAQIAAAAVVVDAKHEKAASIYKSYDFIPLKDRPDRLFLPMHIIRQIFA